MCTTGVVMRLGVCAERSSMFIISLLNFSSSDGRAGDISGLIEANVRT